MSDRLSQNRLAIAAIALIALPIGIVIGVLIATGSDERGPVPAAVIADAVAFEYDQRRGVQLQLTWESGPSLYAPAWSGTVGSLTESRSLANGDEIARVDGVARVVAATPEPFYRILASGSTGPDVGWLHDFLNSLGFAAPNGNVMTDASVAAVSALAKQLGITGAVAAFDPAWVVWLPRTPFAMASVTLVVGAPAPPAGSAIATAPPTLTTLGLQPVDGAAFDSSLTSDYVVSVNGIDLELDADGNVPEVERTRLAESLASETPEEIQGSVRRKAPIAVWTVPTTAVSSGRGGDACVWVQRDGDYVAQLVTVVGSQAGVTYVERPSERESVLVNPADILESTECPSS